MYSYPNSLIHWNFILILKVNIMVLMTLIMMNLILQILLILLIKINLYKNTNKKINRLKENDIIYF